MRQRVFAGRGIDAGRERIALALDLHDDRVADHERRRGHADVVGRRRMLERQTAIPQQVAVEVEADEIVRREEREDPLAVGGRRRRGDGTRRMAERAAGRPELTLPKQLAVGGRIARDVQPILIRPRRRR